MIHFCHIAPTKYLEAYLKPSGRHKYQPKGHMMLAHLVETDKVYADFYRDHSGAFYDDGEVVPAAWRSSQLNPRIMDNSAFEMYKQGRPMYTPEKLIEMANIVRPSHVVMTDYPGEASDKTFQMALQQGEQFHNADYKTMYVPQSVVGDVADYFDGWRKAILNPYFIDIIGNSILGAPNAFGVEKDNKLQRFLSRWKVMKTLDKLGLLEEGYKLRGNKPYIHFLGMVDGPNEIDLVRDYHKYILSWDSSAAVWAGIHDIRFDHSPTGLINGKFEKEVDFDYSVELTGEQRDAISFNIAHIERMC